MKNTLVSIIIPIYNGSKYLHQLLDSLTNQSYKNIEILCVDNDSLDDSANIIEKFAQKDSRIRYLFCEVSGVSNARNKGVEQAVGRYIMFVDCDDILHSNAVALSYEAMVKHNVDMVAFGINVINAKTLKVIEDKNNYYNNDYFTKNEVVANDRVLANAHRVPIFSFAKLYKADIIKNNHLVFPNSIIYNEDVVFNFMYYSHMKNAIYLDVKMYDYFVDNKNSIMQKIHLRYNDLFISNTIMQDQMLKNNSFEIAKIAFYEIAMRNILMLARKKNLFQKDFYIKAHNFLSQVDDKFIKNKKIKLLKKSAQRFYIKYKIVSNMKYFLANYLPRKIFGK